MVEANKFRDSFLDGESCQTTLFESVSDIHPSTIFRNRNVFNSTYIPPKILQRDTEIKDITRRLKPLLGNSEAMDFIIHGGTGVGKTVIVRYVIDELMKWCSNHRIDYIHPLYINCKKIKHEGGLLVEIANSFINDRIKPSLTEFTPRGVAPDTGWSASIYYKFLIKVLNLVGGQFLIVFDEAEKMERKAKDILYTLTRETQQGIDNAKCSLILITNRPKFFDSLDDQIKSSFGWSKMFINPYKPHQIYEILKQRADIAFIEGAIEEDMLRRIAARAASERGDARYAIEILRHAAEIVEEGGLEITVDLIDSAIDEIEYDEISKIITNAPIHKRIFLSALLCCIEKPKLEPTTQNIYKVYNKMCHSLDVKPVSNRWIRTIITEYYDINLIDAETVRGGIHGTQRVLELTFDSKILADIIKKDETLSSLLSDLKLVKTSTAQRSLV